MKERYLKFQHNYANGSEKSAAKAKENPNNQNSIRARKAKFRVQILTNSGVDKKEVVAAEEELGSATATGEEEYGDRERVRADGGEGGLESNAQEDGGRGGGGGGVEVIII